MTYFIGVMGLVLAWFAYMVGAARERRGPKPHDVALLYATACYAIVVVLETLK